MHLARNKNRLQKNYFCSRFLLLNSQAKHSFALYNANLFCIVLLKSHILQNSFYLELPIDSRSDIICARKIISEISLCIEIEVLFIPNLTAVSQTNDTPRAALVGFIH
jgi:hypothetical protein